MTDQTQNRYVGGDETNLIINYLPQSLTDEDFRNMFLSVGPVKSSRIIRDKNSNYSFGFGFVDYFTESDAKRAIQTLNGYHIDGKTMKVALARPSGDDTKGANLYIRNLPAEWTKENLDSHFKEHGEIVQSRILMDQVTNTSRRVGFVLYTKRSDAETAIEKKNGKTPPGASEPIYIKFADNKDKSGPTKVGNNVPTGMPNFFPNSTPFMGFNPRMNFPGPPNQPIPPIPPNPMNPPNAQVNNFNDFSIDNNMSARYPGPGPMRNQTRMRYNPVASTQGPNVANVANAATGQENSEGHALYVYNIGSCSEKNLWDIFTPYGIVSKVAIVYDLPKGVSKGYAFVTMPNYAEAQNAIYNLNGYDLLGSGRALQVSFKTQKK